MPADNTIQTLIDLYDAATARDSAGLLNHKRDGRWQGLSAFDVVARTRELALGLQALGVIPGARVGLLSENRPEWSLADLAILNCAAINVPVHTTQAPAQVEYILHDAGVTTLFVSGQAQYDRLRENLRAVPALGTIVTFDDIVADDPRVISLDNLLRRGCAHDAAHPDRYEQTRRAVRPEHLATLIYTSGTTGQPKGVMLTHRNLVTGVLTTQGLLGLREGHAALSFLPLSHIFERAGFYLYLHARCAIYYAESVEAVAQNLAEVRPHYMTSVPRLFEKIHARMLEQAARDGALKSMIVRHALSVAAQWAALDNAGQPIPTGLKLRHAIADRLVYAKLRARVGGNIKYFISGGAPLALELARIFYGAGLPILQGYGLTESAPVITANMPNANRLGSVGRVIPGVSIRLEPDGEILCHGPNVMAGYYNQPEATAEALVLDDNGQIWLRTGDIGQLDADGYLYITDRKKDLIKTSLGKYIAPQPIENAIKRSRFVNQVVVIGDQRKFPVALIVPHMDALTAWAATSQISSLNTAQLLTHPRVITLLEQEVDQCTPDLAHYEKIKAVALLENEMTIENGELTPTLKVKRRVVMDKYRTLIDQLYAGQEQRHTIRRQ
ncbi:MAG: AMP-dependent synthetase/ligase [Blastocatellia bacterium]